MIELLKSVRLFESGTCVFLRILNFWTGIIQRCVTRIRGVGNLHTRGVGFCSSFVCMLFVSTLVELLLERSFSGGRPGLVQLFNGRIRNRSGTSRFHGLLHLNGPTNARLVLVWRRLWSLVLYPAIVILFVDVVRVHRVITWSVPTTIRLLLIRVVHFLR